MPPATALPINSSVTNATERLQRTMAAVRVSITWLGIRRSLTPQQKEEAAGSFGAAGEYLSAAKKLLDTRHPAYRQVTAVRSQALTFWKSMSLPYPEPGLRLIRQDRIDAFHRQMTAFQSQLVEGVTNLDARYGELRLVAQDRLGRLYNQEDYPPSLVGMFSIFWDYPSVQPPDYLMSLNPALYEQEQARMTARFEEAVKLAEEAFIAEFSGLVGHLVERLSGDGGEKKVFRDSVVNNLSEFFGRFKALNVRSNEQLDELVEQAQRIVADVGPESLRGSGNLRQQIATQLSAVQSVLDGMLIDRPRRRILRAVTAAAPTPANQPG